MSKTSPKSSINTDEHKEANGVNSFGKSEDLQPRQLMEELVSKIRERKLEGRSMPPSVLAVLRELYDLEESEHAVEAERIQNSDHTEPEMRNAASEDTSQGHAEDTAKLPASDDEKAALKKSQSKRKGKEVANSVQDDQEGSLEDQEEPLDSATPSMALDPLAVQVYHLIESLA